jgi:hypothetical protein
VLVYDEVNVNVNVQQLKLWEANVQQLKLWEAKVRVTVRRDVISNVISNVISIFFLTLLIIINKKINF